MNKAIKKHLDYRVITGGNHYIVKAMDYRVGMFGVSFFGMDGKVIHWFKTKDVSGVTLECASELK